MTITVFGKGNMGKAIGGNFEKAGQKVVYAGHDFKDELGDIVVLAVPYGAVDSILEAHKAELSGKVIIDITNPVDFSTMDSMSCCEGCRRSEESKRTGSYGVPSDYHGSP